MIWRIRVASRGQDRVDDDPVAQIGVVIVGAFVGVGDFGDGMEAVADGQCRVRGLVADYFALGEMGGRLVDVVGADSSWVGDGEGEAVEE